MNPEQNHVFPRCVRNQRGLAINRQNFRNLHLINLKGVVKEIVRISQNQIDVLQNVYEAKGLSCERRKFNNWGMHLTPVATIYCGRCLGDAIVGTAKRIRRRPLFESQATYAGKSQNFIARDKNSLRRVRRASTGPSRARVRPLRERPSTIACGYGSQVHTPIGNFNAAEAAMLRDLKQELPILLP